MNKKYIIDHEPVIVSQEEHEHILREIKAGRTKVWLRGNSLLVDYAMTSLVKDTGEMTEPQEREKVERLKLNAPEYKEPSPEKLKKFKDMSASFKEKMVWVPHSNW